MSMENPAIDLKEPVRSETAADIVGSKGGAGCSCGGATSQRADEPATPVYAIGRIEPRFPSLGVEKEFVQATGRAETAGLTDRQALHAVLSQRQSRYLARQLCWVLTIEGIPTYLLLVKDPGDLDLLIEAVRPAANPADVDVVIGTRGSLASPAMCNGLVVPLLGIDQIYSFDTAALISGIPRPETIPEEKFRPSATELFTRIMQMADNCGASDAHRAINYLAVRYPGIYATMAAQHARNASLRAVDVRPSSLSSIRRVVDVIFTYTNRDTDFVDKFYVRVDVTERFPHLVSKIQHYYDR